MGINIIKFLLVKILSYRWCIKLLSFKFQKFNSNLYRFVHLLGKEIGKADTKYFRTNNISGKVGLPSQRWSTPGLSSASFHWNSLRRLHMLLPRLIFPVLSTSLYPSEPVTSRGKLLFVFSKQIRTWTMFDHPSVWDHS